MSGKKKGTSAEEKKKKLLKIYHDAKEPFSQKELAKAGAAAGINEKLVPEINQALLDDSLVMTDKIGSSNFFWSFPSQQGQAAMKQLADAKTKVASAKVLLEEARAKEAAARVGKEDVDGARTQKLEKLKALVESRAAMEADLEALKENDPEELARLQKLGDEFKGHAQRWTENLFAVKSWLVKDKGVASYQVDELFKAAGLPKNLDIE
ncbi:meiotic nuclear division protein 1 [Pelagophyceae sp. CCMP2097]|nr:meiotic nuclear division protein 1 [Pelagophyceae sp. CCMP2097]|mmetsp:Transcript_18163/g.62449  ORF Transcript_18163/g.62449 Transcript_18163/m.62449 type:complete len:209 (+) Transcript_18163:56-682(+)